MTMTSCPDCGKPISDRAPVCPRCGRQNRDLDAELLALLRASGRARRRVACVLALAAAVCVAVAALVLWPRGDAGFAAPRIETVRVEPGTFIMTGRAWESGGVYANAYRRQVTLTRPFLLSKTKITQGQWAAVMGTQPSRFDACGENCPVENVSWPEAVEFCNRLSDRTGLTRCYAISGRQVSWVTCSGFRLPTEAEWEYAARAGIDTLYGPVDLPPPAGDCGENPYGTGPHPVTCSNANAWGAVGMLGNAFEWTWDWYDPAAESIGMGEIAEVADPEGPKGGERRTFRGRGWCDFIPDCVSATGVTAAPDMKNADLGFRVVRQAP